MQPRAWTTEQDAHLTRRWDALRLAGVPCRDVIRQVAAELARTTAAVKARRNYLRESTAAGRPRRTCQRCEQPAHVGPDGLCVACRTELEVAAADPRPRVLVSLTLEDARRLSVKEDGTLPVVLRLPAGDVEALAAVHVLRMGEPGEG